MPGIGSATASTTAGNVIQSIRAQIPDPVANPANDGNAFTAATLIRWINDAGRIMASRAPIVQDWYAIQSINGQMTYALPSIIVTVEQLWYDLRPCVRAAELDDLYVQKVTARSYFFGPHTVHANPTLHLWPACNRTGATTTIVGALTATDTSVTLASGTNFQNYGYFTVESELIRYETITTTTGAVSTMLRGQGGTTAAAHNAGAGVTENNIFFKASRLPNAITASGDLIEIPLGLTPLLELYVLAKVRESEQESERSLRMMKEFEGQMDRLSAAYAPRGVRQGVQVRMEPPGNLLYFGRVIVPAVMGLMVPTLAELLRLTA